MFGIFFGLGWATLWIFTAAWFMPMQPTVIVVPGYPEGRDVQIIKLQEQLDATKEPESPDSLRRRTSKLADEFTRYWENTQENKARGSS
jgi:hypothetical protein